MDESEYPHVPWRTGRTVGRTIYAMRGVRASDTDPLIGVMDTPSLARAAVDAHNMRMGHEVERNGIWKN